MTRPIRIPITDDILALMACVQDRAGGARELGRLLELCPNCPPDLSAMTVYHLLKGRNHRILRSHLRFFGYLSLAPDQSFELDQARAKPSQKLLTPGLVGEMLWLREHTGIGPQKLLSGLCGVPTGLNSGHVNAWLNGNTRAADPVWIGFVLRHWRNAPIMRVLSDAERRELREAMDAAGLTPQSLLNRMRPHPPELTTALLGRWLSGKAKRVNVEWWDMVVKAAG